MVDYSQVDWSQAVTANLADIKETKEKLAKKKFEKKEVDLTKYFNTQLEKDETSGNKIFRALPCQDNPYEFVKKVYFHNMLIEKKWTKLYDPSQNGTIEGVESPLNDARKALNAHPDKEVKKQAAKYKPKLFYIIRGIDRDKEEEGVKFWRFGTVSDGTGAMDKIEPLIAFYNKQGPGKGAFWNPIAGRDFFISLAKDESKGFSKITAIIVGDPSPLHTNPEIANAWLSDKMTWEDVYSKKSVEYLRIVAEGGVPIWDKSANNGEGGLVAKTEGDANPSSTNASAPAPQAPPKPTAAVEYNEGEVITEIEDLPF